MSRGIGAMTDGFPCMAYAMIAPAAAIRRLLSALAGAMAIAVAVATLLALPNEGAAADEGSQFGDWFVVELRGSGFSRPTRADGAQWQSLQPGAVIAAGSVVRTGGNGHLLLANRVDRIRLSPNSELELPESGEADAVTRVIHWIGTALFDVGKRPSPQFEVDTPYLVAVVKGTAFTTTVSDAGSTVKVMEGIVGVAPAQGGTSVDVAAGETASVSASDGDTVTPGDLSGATSPGQGGAASGQSTTATAATDTDVEGDTVTGPSGGSTARSGQGRGGGNGNGGHRDGNGSVRHSGRGAGSGQGDGDGDGGDGDGHGHGNGGDGDGDGHGHGNGGYGDGDRDGDDGGNHDDDHGDGCHGGGCHDDHHHGGVHRRR